MVNFLKNLLLLLIITPLMTSKAWSGDLLTGDIFDISHNRQKIEIRLDDQQGEAAYKQYTLGQWFNVRNLRGFPHGREDLAKGMKVQFRFRTSQFSRLPELTDMIILQFTQTKRPDS
ncbi:hypothetical protein ACQZV8_12790 [Magnetococcales bacterium HHB-1]